MQVYVNGHGVRLDKQHYLSQGGEGAVYARGSTAYKIYADSKKMIPVAKIQELALIKDSHVVKPLEVITNKGGNPIGYTMSYVKSCLALCQLFPRAFRERNSLDIPQITDLVRQLQDCVKHVHVSRILVVDLNEMNFLVSKKFDHLYCIDVDSYQTKSFPATALMESIRDRHMKGPRAFTTLTDWFAFAVVSFQMFCGIHPFKGRHKKLKGLDARMKANISVFNSSVRIPKAAYPVHVIPAYYRDWYKAVFEHGVRTLPPTEAGAIVVVVPDLHTIVGTNLLDIEEVANYNAPVQSVWDFGQNTATVVEGTVWLNGHIVPEMYGLTDAVIYSPRRHKAVAVSYSSNVHLYNLTDRQNIDFPLQPSNIMVYNGDLYMQVHNQVHRLELLDAGTQVLATTQPAATVMENATQMFSGVLLQNMLGSMHVSVFPKSGSTVQTMVGELDAYRVLDAKYDRHVLMVVGEKKGKYDRLVFRFDEAHSTYDVRVVEDITPTGINFVVLDSDVVVCLNEDEKLEMFLNKKNHAKLSHLEDPVLGGDMTLARVKGQLHFYRGDKLYKMSMKKSK